jgi:site-specific recombinase XerD
MSTIKLRTLTAAVLQTMQKNEMNSEETLSLYARYGFSTIERHFEAIGVAVYSAAKVNNFVHAYRVEYERGTISEYQWRHVRRSAALLETFHKTGATNLPDLPKWGLREPTEIYGNLLEAYCAHASREGKMGDSTIKTKKCAIRGFLFALEDAGNHSLDGVTLKQVGDIVTTLAHKYSGGTVNMALSVRNFLRFLHENSLTRTDLSVAVPTFVSQRRSVREGFSAGETQAILDVVDRTTAVGCRDYAMMMLAAQTGLRAVDIKRLKRSEIDWRRNEICIVQDKTDKGLCLPLKSESGNAIADYLLYHRPNSDLPFVFLCRNKPFRPMTNLGGRLAVHKCNAQIDTTIPRRGVHSFRRAFGTRLLEAEVPIELLSQLLGHSHIDSARPYLSASEQGLKSCALGLTLAKDGENNA